MVPSYYNLYYYETARMLRYQESHPTRASVVMDVERRLLERYSDPQLREKPPELMERGGAYYSESAAALMADIYRDAGSVQIVNVRNDGAIPDLPDDVVVEVPARITRDGARAVPTAPLRRDVDALVRRAKDFELLTIEAALSGDVRDRAARADDEPARAARPPRAGRVGADPARQRGAHGAARVIVAGVDGGGTKTDAVVCDGDGHVLGYARGGHRELGDRRARGGDRRGHRRARRRARRGRPAP